MANEKRLIDANALVADLELLAKHEDDFRQSVILGVAHTVRNRPTVDAVEVVRCKDCKWYKEGELLAPNKFCFRLKHPTEDRNVGYNFCDDDFCSYGERREGE